MKTKFTRISSILLAVILLVAMVPMYAFALNNGGQGGTDAGELQWICVSGVHSWDSGVVTTTATCEELGVKTYTCTLCGTTKTENIPALGHNYDDGVVTTQPTCTETGVKTYTCQNDSTHSYTETIPANGHTFAGEWTVVTPATCTTPGLETNTCTVCGVVEREIPVAAHVWVEWQEGDDIADFELKTAATTESAAIYYKKCSVGGESAKDIDETQTFTYGNPLPACVFGDVNGDGAVAPYDAVLLSMYFADLVEAEALSAGADVNGDGAVAPYDAVLLSMYFADLVTLDDLGPQS